MVRTNKSASAGGRKRRASTPPPALPPLTLLTYLSTYKPSADASSTASVGNTIDEVMESRTTTQNPSSGSVNVLQDVIVKNGIAAEFEGVSCSNEGDSQRASHGHLQQTSNVGSDLPVLFLEDCELDSNINFTMSNHNAGKTAHTTKVSSNKKIKIAPSSSGCQNVSHLPKSSTSPVVHNDILPSVSTLNVNKNKNAKSSSTQPTDVAPLTDHDSELEVFSQAETRNDVLKFIKIYQQLRRKHDLNLQICQEHPQILQRISDMREMAAKLEADVKEQRDALDKSTKELRYIDKKMGD